MQFPQLTEDLPELLFGLRVGFFDFFYLPRKAFPVFGQLAQVFAKHAVYLEVAGPNILTMTKALTGLELQEFNCTLGVKPPLTLLQISAPDFHCGHEVHYQEDGILRTVSAMLEAGRPMREDSLARIPMAFLHLPAKEWSIWIELPVVCLVILGLCLGACGLETITTTLSTFAFSLLVCAAYVLISVTIDLSIARQARMSAKTPEEDYVFEPMCAVLLTEGIKLLVSLCLAIKAEKFERLTAADVKWLGSSAALFTLNNLLVWWAIGSNDLSTFGVLRDTIILWTALFWRLLFGRPLGLSRVGGVAIVLAGLWLNQVQILTFSKFSWAPFLVLSMTACNALASVINEFGLKQHHSANINLQNALLYSACIFFTLATMVFSGRVHSVYHRGYFYGFTRHTVFTILLQAVAGLTVSRILKYADAVQKNVAASLRGPILVCVSPLVGSMANTQTLLSALLVSCGCTIYLLQGPLSASESKAEQTGQTR